MRREERARKREEGEREAVLLVLRCVVVCCGGCLIGRFIRPPQQASAPELPFEPSGEDLVIASLQVLRMLQDVPSSSSAAVFPLGIHFAEWVSGVVCDHRMPPPFCSVHRTPATERACTCTQSVMSLFGRRPTMCFVLVVVRWWCVSNSPPRVQITALHTRSGCVSKTCSRGTVVGARCFCGWHQLASNSGTLRAVHGTCECSALPCPSSFFSASCAVFVWEKKGCVHPANPMQTDMEGRERGREERTCGVCCLVVCKAASEVM